MNAKGAGSIRVSREFRNVAALREKQLQHFLKDELVLTYFRIVAGAHT
jgi:hypothetical protein